MTIAEVKKLADRAVIPELCVKFVQAYEKRSGTSENGPWTLQNIKVQDDTGSMIVIATNRSEDFAKLGWEGKQIVLSSGRKRGQVVGLFAYDDHYGDTVTRKAKLTPAGEIRLAEADAAHIAGEHTGLSPQERLTLEKAGALMEFCQRIGQGIYPNDAQAAAAVGNTLFIAATRGALNITAFLEAQSQHKEGQQ